MTDLQKWLTEHGCYKVAKALGLSYPAVRKWKDGKCKPSAKNISAVAKLSGMTRKQIMGGK